MTNNARLTATIPGNLGKPIPECETIPEFANQRDMLEVAVPAGTLRRAKSQT